MSSYLTKEERLYRIKSNLSSGFNAIGKHSIKVEFYLALIIAILMISSLLLERYMKLSPSITIILMLSFIGIKIHNLTIKKGSLTLEDTLSLSAMGIFLALKLLLNRAPSSIMISAISLILLYSIGVMPRVDSLMKSRSIASFISSYLVFILIVIFLFSSFYSSNSSDFQLNGQKASIDFQDSLYFSTITFTTVGYGDITPLENNRIVAAIEAIAGMILNIGFIGYVLSSKKDY